jgi:hypothetical protein
MMAAPITSAGRFSPLGPRGMFAPFKAVIDLFYTGLHRPFPRPVLGLANSTREPAPLDPDSPFWVCRLRWN